MYKIKNLLFVLLLGVFFMTSIAYSSDATAGISVVNNTYKCNDTNHLCVVQGDSTPVALFTEALINSGTTVSFSEGYIDIKVEEGNSAYDKLYISPGNYSNGITVSNDFKISTSDGSIIGVIDNMHNGQNGWLRINFSSPMGNGGFDNGESGWNIVDDMCTYDGIDNGSANGMTYSHKINNYGDDHGNYLYLEISGRTDCYGIVHGPYAISSPFSAMVGDSIKFDWKATRTGDAYDVYAYIEDGSKKSQLLYKRGSGTTDWATETIELKAEHFSNGSSSDNLKFIFICGSYDATGGTVIGSNYSIDNARVSNKMLSGSDVQGVLEIIGYKCTDNNAVTGDKTVNITAYSKETNTEYAGSGKAHILSVTEGDSEDQSNNTVIDTSTYNGQSHTALSDAIVIQRADKLGEGSYSENYSDYGVTTGIPNYEIFYKEPSGSNYTKLSEVSGDSNINNIINAGVYKVVGKVPYYLNGSIFTYRYYTYYVNIEQQTPDYSVPTPREIIYGSKLNDISLPIGYTWEDSLTTNVGNVGERTFDVTYAPDDTLNYKCVNDIAVTVNVTKAPLSISANDKTIVFGDEPDNDGIFYEGFVNNETVADLKGTLTYEYNYIKYGNVGTGYSITPSGITSNNYEIKFIDGTLTVNKKPVSLSMMSNVLDNYTYTGERIMPKPTVTDGDMLTEFDYSISYGNNINVLEGGNINLSATETGNYSGSVTYSFHILPKKVLVPIAKSSVRYNGEIQHGIESGTLYSLTNHRNKDADNYTAVAALNDKSNYVWDLDVDSNIDQSIQYLISPKPISVVWRDLELEYNKEDQKPSATVETGIEGENISLVIGGGKTDAGTYEAVATMETSNTNYVLENSTSEFEIKKGRNEWIHAPSIDDWSYGDTANSPSALAKFGEVFYEYSEEENGIYSSKTPILAGEYWLKAYTNYNSNYGAIVSKVRFNIDKKEISSPTVNTQEMVYNGLEQSLNIEENANYTIKDNSRKDVGINFAVVSINDKDNYKWDDGDKKDKKYTLSIIPAELNIIAKNASIVYGDTPKNQGVDYKGFVNNESKDILSGTLVYNYDYIRLGKVGNSYSIIPSGLYANNYKINYTNGNLTVGKRELSNVNIEGLLKEYEYTSEGIKPEILVSDNEMLNALDYQVIYDKNINVLDGGKVIIKATTVGNYVGEVELSFNIIPKPLILPKAIQGITYTEEIQRGVVEGFLYDVINGTGKNVGKYYARLVINDKDNYIWAIDETNKDKYIVWEILPNENIEPKAKLSENQLIISGNLGYTSKDEQKREEEKTIAEEILSNQNASIIEPLGLNRAALKANNEIGNEEKSMNPSISYLVKLKIVLNGVEVEKESNNTNYTINYSVNPMQAIEGTNDWEIIEPLKYKKNNKFNANITFRLPLPDSIPKGMTHVRVEHTSNNGEIIDINTYPVQKDGKGREYIEVTSCCFSKFTLKFVSGAEYKLTVINGEINQNGIDVPIYSKDAEVEITAAKKDGKRFDKWISKNDGINIYDKNSATTIISGFTEDTTITACYKNSHSYWWLLILLVPLSIFIILIKKKFNN